MSGPLTHSPADVLQRVLIALGQGTDPDDGGAWPVYVTGEPGTPDAVVTVFDTAGRDGGREMIAGERQEHHGVQVRVRSSTHAIGWTKARAIAVALDQSVYQEAVTLDGTSYLLHSVSRTGDVLAIGKESPASKRSVFTINAVVSLREV